MGSIRAALLVLMVVSLVFSVTPFSKADPWNRNCTDGVETDFLNDSGVIINQFYKTCPTGCNNQTLSCDEPYNVPVEFFVLTVVALLAISVIFIIIANKFPDNWKIIEILFYISSVFFVLMAIGVMGSFFMMGQNAASYVINTAYLAAGFIVFVFIAYIVMRFMLNFLMGFMSNLKRGGR